MLELFRIAGRIDLEGADKANKELDGLDKKGKGIGSKLGAFAKNVGKAGAVVGGAMVGLGSAAFAMTEKVTGAFDDISKGAQRVGVSTDFYQELDFWASQNGMSHEQMEKAVGRFNQRMGQALDGNEKYSSALQRMGVNLDKVRDGTLSTEDAFAQSIQSLSEMENSQEQVAVATEMFGTRMARQMLPALQDGALSLDDARKKAQELGLVIGEDSLAAGVKFQDTWDQLKRSMTTAGQQILGQMMPAFQGLMDWVIAHMPQIQAFIKKAFDVISTVFNTAVNWVQSLIAWFKEWFTSNEETMTGIWETVQEKFTLVLDFLRNAWETIKTFWQEHGATILENAKTIFLSIYETVQTYFEATREAIMQVLEFIVPWIQEKIEMIKKFWDENGEQIMQAVQNAFTFIQNIIKVVMPIVVGIIKNAWNIIKNVIDGVLGVIMGLIKVFMGVFTGDWKKIWEGVKQIVTSIQNTVKGVFQAIFQNIGNIMTNIWSKITGTFNKVVTFLKNLRSKFFEAGIGLITQLIDGISSMISKVTDTVSNIAGKVRDFLPFSPAKVGPLSDLDKLDFEGPITDSIAKGERSIQQKMADLLNMREPSLNMNVGSRTITQQESTSLQGVLQEQNNLLMQILNKNQDIYLDSEPITERVNTTNAINDAVNYFG